MGKSISEDAAFKRCIDFMTRMLEKYGADENTAYNNEDKEDRAR